MGFRTRTPFTNVSGTPFTAINKCAAFSFHFPTSEHEMPFLAAGLKKKSAAHFDNSIGCIDGMLLWTEQPRVIDRKHMKRGGTARFHSSRKNK